MFYSLYLWKTISAIFGVNSLCLLERNEFLYKILMVFGFVFLRNCLSRPPLNEVLVITCFCLNSFKPVKNLDRITRKYFQIMCA